MARFKNIIFLDEEGTGLSPYAAVLMRKKLEDKAIGDINVYAKGNVVLFPEPANQKITEVARINGMSLDDYCAEELDGTEFCESTLILTFNASSKQKVYDRFPNSANVYMLKEFVGETGDIRMPLGGDINEYQSVCAVIDRVLESLFEKFDEMNEQLREAEEQARQAEEQAREAEEQARQTGEQAGQAEEPSGETGDQAAQNGQPPETF